MSSVFCYAMRQIKKFKFKEKTQIVIFCVGERRGGDLQIRNDVYLSMYATSVLKTIFSNKNAAFYTGMQKLLHGDLFLKCAISAHRILILVFLRFSATLIFRRLK